MSSFPIFGFGIEVEAVVQPWKVRPEWRGKPQEYYERLALALRNRNLKALSDNLAGSYRSHPEHYDKWFITKDGSLQGSGDEICVEAVSPVLRTGTQAWENEMTLFWDAMRKVFKVRENFTCGSHVHVAPFGRKYNLPELKIIAFAVVVYEDLVHYILPAARQENTYCKRNSAVSPKLKEVFQNGKNKNSLSAVGNKIKQVQTKQDLWAFMQGNEPGGRYVIWNFKNIFGSGTVEFRGGRHLRGPNRTQWWITFAVAFVSLALKTDLLKANKSVYNPPKSTEGPFQKQLSQFWENIKEEADRLKMSGHLPASWKRMKELRGS